MNSRHLNVLCNLVLFSPQVGDQIVEINGEPTQGITHTRAIELIQSGGNKVLLLLRPGTGLIPDHGKMLELLTCLQHWCMREGIHIYLYFIWRRLLFLIVKRPVRKHWTLPSPREAYPGTCLPGFSSAFRHSCSPSFCSDSQVVFLLSGFFFISLSCSSHGGWATSKAQYNRGTFWAHLVVFIPATFSWHPQEKQWCSGMDRSLSAL